MPAQNDVTGDTLTTGVVSDQYRAGFDAIDWGATRKPERGPVLISAYPLPAAAEVVTFSGMVGHDCGADTRFIRVAPKVWLLQGAVPVSVERAEQLERIYQGSKG